VIVRFFVRMIVLVVFANFGGIGFGRSLAALLWMSTILSAVIGAMRREPLLDAVLNHWDETVAYAALCAAWSWGSTRPSHFETTSRDLIRLV
jgi:hypothetical protein